MNKEELMNILPHRDNMLLVEEAYLDEEGKSHGKYTVKGDEFFLQGHFPGNPVVPGVILCEMMGQASCMLFQEELKGKIAYYAGIDKVRFRRMVRPGDTLELRSELIRQKLNVMVVRAEARVDGELCMSGELSFILTQPSVAQA